jgi:hypothetical protein
MQALSDDQHIDVLEKKMDKGFAEVRADIRRGSEELRAQITSSERGLRTEIVAARSDARADFRTLITVVIAMWTATLLGVVALLVNHS